MRNSCKAMELSQSVRNRKADCVIGAASFAILRKRLGDNNGEMGRFLRVY